MIGKRNNKLKNNPKKIIKYYQEEKGSQIYKNMKNIYSIILLIVGKKEYQLIFIYIAYL